MRSGGLYRRAGLTSLKQLYLQVGPDWSEPIPPCTVVLIRTYSHFWRNLFNLLPSKYTSFLLCFVFTTIYISFASFDHPDFSLEGHLSAPNMVIIKVLHCINQSLPLLCDYALLLDWWCHLVGPPQTSSFGSGLPCPPRQPNRHPASQCNAKCAGASKAMRWPSLGHNGPFSFF